MSYPITLLKQDYLIVKGHRYEVKNPEETLDCIALDFTIQVNGKMANFENSFIICSFSDDGRGASGGVENDGEWFLIIRILLALGYKIAEDVSSSMSLLDKWIEQIKESEQE